MGDETSKSHAMRLARGDYDTYLKGRGIDIGCGTDVLSGDVRPWDINDGDATLMEGVEDGSFDFAYSSHCLEHIADVRTALFNWARIVKPGGYIYFAVPDYTLYEHHRWTSIYNPDHKSSFSLWIPRAKVGRENHYGRDDLLKIFDSIGCVVRYIGLEDDGYDYNGGERDQTREGALAQICIITQKSR